MATHRHSRFLVRITRIFFLLVCGSAAASSSNAYPLYVADYDTGFIYQYTAGGIQSTFASGLNGPEALAIDAQGDVFVADRLDGNLYKFAPGGTESLFASGLNVPALGLAISSAGNIFVSNSGSNEILEYTPSGAKSTFATLSASPFGLAFNGAGDLFVAESAAGQILELTPGGSSTVFASGLNFPTSLAFNASGDLFVAVNAGQEIVDYSPMGAETLFSSTAFGDPDTIAFDAAGNLFMGSQDGIVYEFAPNGTDQIFATPGLPNDVITVAFGLTAAPPPSSVPEPSSLALLSSCFACWAFTRKKLFPLNGSYAFSADNSSNKS